jgi:hypothetical protein
MAKNEQSGISHKEFIMNNFSSNKKTFFCDIQSATNIINNQKEKEKEKEKETFEGSLQSPDLTSSSPSNDQFTSFSSWQASPANKNEHVRGLTDRCAGERILTTAPPSSTSVPHHRRVALNKSDLMQNIAQQDVKYCRISVYRFTQDLENNQSDNERIRINVSLKFWDEALYAPLLDHNGFCKLVFKCSDRIRELMRGTVAPYAQWSGYQAVRDFAMQHPAKLAGKGSFVGERGNKRTPPPAYYSAIAMVSEERNLLDQPYALIRVGNFSQEIELYQSDSKLFGYHGEYAV